MILWELLMLIAKKEKSDEFIHLTNSDVLNSQNIQEKGLVGVIHVINANDRFADEQVESVYQNMEMLHLA